ncbi:4'-phosphopantetheinyl transferase [Streptomyces sp. NPDC090022]|uniref:4'-phosphopantetheinyl transferase family protein n=1 Tax=Streptomyces sp. NPDC090022 TaxID=3365920 RepID=UPI0037F3EB17
MLPSGVSAVETFGDPWPLPALLPEEARLTTRMTPDRRREFATVRACARAAMGDLGLPPSPVLRGPRGEPRWAAGLVGSMTHCTGYRAAAVARSADIASLGIDAETNAPLPQDGMLRIVSTPEERRWLAPLTEQRPDIAWDRLLFSAKESVYKAWYPLTGRWLDFDEAVITVHPDTRTFTARLLVPGPLLGGVRRTTFHGHWRAAHGLIMTSIALPAGQKPFSTGSRIATHSTWCVTRNRSTQNELRKSAGQQHRRRK